MSISSSAHRVQQASNAVGLDLCVVELPASTRSAAEAAQAIGCQVGQIASRWFSAGNKAIAPSSSWLRALTASMSSASPRRWASHSAKPTPTMRQRTGYAIRGVPPIGHSEALLTLVDEDLLAYDEIGAAAGTPHAVFRLTPADLLRMTQGQVAAIK